MSRSSNGMTASTVLAQTDSSALGIDSEAPSPTLAEPDGTSASPRGAGQGTTAAAFPAQVLTLANVGEITGRDDAPESSVGGESTCIVCMSLPKTHLAVPCAHQCVCGPCAARMQLCPYCRAPVQAWLQVHVV